jgi:hypothetical protein
MRTKEEYLLKGFELCDEYRFSSHDFYCFLKIAQCDATIANLHKKFGGVTVGGEIHSQLKAIVSTKHAEAHALLTEMSVSARLELQQSDRITFKVRKAGETHDLTGHFPHLIGRGD